MRGGRPCVNVVEGCLKRETIAELCGQFSSSAAPERLMQTMLGPAIAEAVYTWWRFKDWLRECG